jgi:hypothetical protein
MSWLEKGRPRAALFLLAIGPLSVWHHSFVRGVPFVVAALALAAPAAGMTANATRTAHVTVTSPSPFTVRGAGFLPGERVTVTVAAKATRTRSVTASTRGNFHLTFWSLSIGTCDAYAVRAKGSRGSTAFVKVLPECAAPLPPGPPARNP